MASLVQAVPVVSRSSRAAASQAVPVESFERADVASARVAARELNHRVLVTGMTTSSSQTFVNQDGTLTSEVSPGPVRVRAAKGWQALDTTLTQRPDGTIVAAAVPDALVINGGGGFASLTDGDVSLAAGWSSALPAPSVSGSTVTYAQVAPGVDLLVSATQDGFKYSVRLTQRPSVSSFTIALALKGLSVAQQPDGGLRFVDAKGRTRLVSSAPAMFDARTDAQGQPSHFGAVSSSVSGGSKPALTVSLDAAFLDAAGTVFPVLVDPGGSLQLNDDDYVDAGNASTAYYDPSQFQVGTRNGGANLFRSFYGFHTDPIAGKHVLSASLSSSESSSASCTATPVTVWGTSSTITASTTWGTQPALTSQYASVTAAKGFDAVNCPAGTLSWDVTGLAQSWATQPAGVRDLALVAGNESDNNSWKLFNGSPTLSVTYNTPSDTPSRLFPSAGSKVGTANVTFSAQVTDPDGGSVTGQFDVQDTTQGTTVAVAAAGSTVTSGGQSSLLEKGLVNGDSYQWRVRATDGVDPSGYTPWQSFTVDTTQVAAPVIVSTNYAPNVWSPTSLAQPSNFSWTTTSSDVSGWEYQLDGGSWSVPASVSSLTWNPTRDGFHTLAVRGLNGAGLIGASASYSYATTAGGSYAGVVSSPLDMQRTQQSVALTAAAASQYTAMDFEYRIGTQAGWTVIPVADATAPGTSTHPSWPVLVGPSGSFPTWNWNLQSTVTNAGGTYGLVQVIACFYTSAAGTGKACSDNQPVSVEYNPRAVGGSYASRPLGPGTLNLASGDYTLSSRDVTLPSPLGALTVGRSYDTLSPTSTNTGFGPGWVADLAGVNAGAADDMLVDHSSDGFVTLTDPAGNQVIYSINTAVGSLPVTFTGLGDAADGSTLVKSLDPYSTPANKPTFTLTTTDGTQTIWQSSDGGKSFPALRVVQPSNHTATGTTSLFKRDASGRISAIFGPAPQGSAVVDCTAIPMPAGCRSLSITYASSTTATGLTTGSWGDYAGNISAITYVNADPSTQSVSGVVVAQYSYDSTGRLRASWDPRLTPALSTTYGYDNGRLSSITPPGLNPWQFGFVNGRLSTVSRPDPNGGTDTSTVIYNVPLSGSTAPVDLSADKAAAWDQTSDLPVTGVAIFPPTYPVVVSYDGNGNPTGLGNNDWPSASLSYLDVNGREVNSATEGNNDWQLSTTRYDAQGHPIVELSAENRDHALGINFIPPGTDQMDPYVAQQANPATRADLLSSEQHWVGPQLKYTLGPTHPGLQDSAAAPAFASLTDLRDETFYSYDQGSPGAAVLNLPTEIQTFAWLVSTSTVSDRRITLTGYDPVVAGDPSGWTLRQPTSTTVQMAASPSSADLTHLTRYNDLGQQIESRMPSDLNGTTADTWRYTYYVVSGTGSCVNPADAGLLCQKAPAAAPSSGPVLPTTTYTYDRWGDTLTSTDSNGTVTRTTSYSYDTIGRLTGRAINITPSQSASTTVPNTSYSYDPATGLPTVTTWTTAVAPNPTLTTGYDSDGRVISYQDTTAYPTATTSYDADGRIKTHFDGLATDTYTYDNAAEHRGVITKLVDSQVGTFTATYNDDGQLQTQTYPSTVTASYQHDDAGQAVALTYSRGNSTYLGFTREYSGHGQAVNDTAPYSHTSYRYDLDGRLGTVTDVDQSTVQALCTIRSYAYDPNSNRISQTDNPPGPASSSNPGGCSTSTTPHLTTHTYDDADRVTTVSDGTQPASSYAYDQLGRTTTVPATDTMPNSGTGPVQPITYTYNTDDTINSEATQIGTQVQTASYGHDGDNRLTIATYTSGGSTTYVYGDSSDRAAYTIDADGIRNRTIRDVTGNNAGWVDASQGTMLEYTDLGGNHAASGYNTPTDIPGAFGGFTEFGGQRANKQPNSGWLGTKDRPRLAYGGLFSMGARIYNPTTGRFLQTDPVPGGSANAYDYVYQDPINSYDLDGRMRDSGDSDAAYRQVGYERHDVHPKCHEPWYGTKPHAVASFLGWRGYIDGGYYIAVRGQVRRGVVTIINGQAVAQGTSMDLKYYAKRNGYKGLLKLTGKVFGAPVGVFATALDYTMPTCVCG